MPINFEDYSEQVKQTIQEKAVAWLEEASGEIESQTKRNCAVVTGKTKGSFQHAVDGSKLEAQIGSNYENAIWEEFGTGQYALYGNGRKTPWAYRDSKGVLHFTHGKQPKRMMFHAYESKKASLEALGQERFGEINDK